MSFFTMSQYHYSSLSPGAYSIRLLRLMPNDLNSPEKTEIHCELFEYSLKDIGTRNHLYEALSYTWGGDKKPCSITVGEQNLNVTQNLHAALLRLRDCSLERIIWVDAICINQKDPKERGQQVQRMAQIYSKAARVLVWLGDIAPDCNMALETIRIAAEDKMTAYSNDKEIRSTIFALLGREWFQRIWVLQEVAAARSILIICGSTMLDGYTFYLGVTHFYEAHPVLECSIRPITSLIRDSIFRSNHAISSSDRGSLNIRPLSELIDMFHTHKATDPVDKVYALLGMSSDDPGTAGLLPNYTIPWKELFKDLVKFILGKEISVKTFEDSQRAIIQSKGYILGQVSSVRSDNRQSVKITSRNAAWDLGGKTEWTLQASAKPIQERDIICLLHGASKPTIIRLRNDHFAVVGVAATPLNGNGSFGWPEISQSIKQFVRDFSLVWDWEKPLAKSQDQEEYENLTKIYCQVLEFSKAEFGDQLDRATRLWNDIMILDDLGEYKRADERLLEAKSSYVATFRKEHLPSRNSQHGRTLVSFAAGEGHKDIVKLLLEKGVEADLKDSRSGRGPLSWAAEKGHEGIVILLLENDTVNPDSQDKEGRTPLSLAAGAGHEVVVKLLLKKRVDAESKCEQTRTPLWWAVSQGQGAVVKLLLENGVDADWKDWGGMTALSWAAYFGHVAVVKLLLDQGVDTDTKDNASRTPLMWAIGFKHETVVKVLLENLEKRVGAQKLLLWAAENGYKVIVTLLLENNNVDPDSKDEKGRTPLSWAAEKEHEDIVTLLLENGNINPDSKDKEGRTPLSFAADAGHEAVVKLLLAFGVNADSKDNYGWTPLSFAADAGHEAVVKLLLIMRVDANSRDNHGRTPLLLAAENDHKGIVQLLHDTIPNSSIQ